MSYRKYVGRSAQYAQLKGKFLREMTYRGLAYNGAMKAMKRRVTFIVILGAMLASQVAQTSKPAAEKPESEQNAAAPPVQPILPGAPASLPSGADVAIIRIDGMIYDFTLESLQRRVDRAMDMGASMIVIELNTPGGVVTSALEIAKYIKGQISVPTIAWINHSAYSAGILIASSCDYIVMSPSSTTGDCAPIVPGAELAPTERAKALSPILEEFRDNARNNDYDYATFHAMCVLGVEVYLIEHKETGERRLVNQVDYQIMVDGVDPNSKNLLKSLFGGGNQSATPQTGADVGQAGQEVATDEDRGQWQLVERVHDGKTLLTLNQTRATRIGLSRSENIRNTADLQNFLNAKTVTRIDQTWSENLAGWLTSLPVRSVLVIALLLGAYIEFQSPGVGLPGAVAVIALIILLGAPFLVGLAEVWHVLIFFIGVVLLGVELLVLPGFGVFGVLGLLCMFVGLVMSVIPTSGSGPMPMPAPEMIGRLQMSVVWTIVGLVGSLVGFGFLMKYYDSIPILSRLVLDSEPSRPAETTEVSGDYAFGGGNIAVGANGRVVAQLRPVGTADIDGMVVDVMSEGPWIEPGQEVKVIEVTGNKIVVAKV